ncbi:hypothetical protein [Actinophytocola xanthii]|uniref:Lipoprotein n=1 Tax=Actinophytocola xanthii TaxID=1912961 RepID=A0A1Q8CWA8_9PSEU|nr:hypothetical protein [Actinophytocola xanthii]OLF18641.1 hypothetical protein BU204_05095 [Actinophytocola xanthii]
MSGTSRVISAIAAVAVLLTLAACTPVSTAGEATYEVEPVARQEIRPTTDPVTAVGGGSGRVTAPVSLNAAEIEDLGRVLTDQAGMTLYRYDRDSADPPVSACEGVCTRAWPPVVVEDVSEVVVSGMARSLLGTVTRSDDTLQLTVAGWPVYRFAQDSAPGEAEGQGAGGVWSAITPDGGRAGAPPGTTPDPPSAPLVTARVLPGFGPALTDGNGLTLYLFTADSSAPPRSTCLDDCARRWPPVLAEGPEPELQGVNPAIVGTLARPDGKQQVTVNGWPVYRFAEDTEPGQTGGHGVDGRWFVIAPDGRKSLAPVQEQAPEAAAEPESDGGY